MSYWLVSLPWLDNADRTWTLLQNKVWYENQFAQNYRFKLPNLKVGTLDSLMVLSDDLVKVNGAVEAVVNKIRRQLFDMQASGNSGDREEVTVEGLPPDEFLERFTWNEAKYPPRRPLKETVNTITETVQKLEDDLKTRMSEYNQLKGQMGALMRKQGGNLAVRDLGEFVKKQDVVSTENLTTVFAVVSKYSKAEWLKCYETLVEYVVPRSAKQVAEDNEYAVFRVFLFRRVVDQFKHEARQRGYQVRDYEFSEERQNSQDQSSQALKHDAEEKRSQLEQWSSTAYGEAFSAWIHICAIRLFTESILRYGVPPEFLTALVKPNAKTTTKLRKLLASMFASESAKEFFDGDAGANAAVAGAETEMHPYVSFTISIET
ncbi:hypothetical protein WJX73_003699 [Symbiochloris irregularis]|uniref:V-type proton ATPase subunit C n=1 Tax=Symbiochloris irregularis TaxID=706552 RepID=A0AAW1PNT7_9CHLO